MRHLAATPDGRVVVAVSDPPVPGPDEALIAVAASGVNRAGLSQIAGHYPPPPGESPILGMEVAGTLVASGERVCALLAGGGHAEYVAAPRGQIFPAPRSLELISAAAIPEAFLTAFVNLAVEGGLGRGGRALVHAGASGVGLASIQTARFLGARVAATTRTAAKLSALREAGADPAIDTSAVSFVEAIEASWGRDAVDVVLDPIGAETLSENFRVLASGGRLIVIATLSGAAAPLDLLALMKKRARVIGSMLRSRSRPEKAALVERFRTEVLPGFDSGALSVTIDSTYPPERAAEAFERMRENRNVGKILIDWRR